MALFAAVRFRCALACLLAVAASAALAQDSDRKKMAEAEGRERR